MQRLRCSRGLGKSAPSGPAAEQTGLQGTWLKPRSEDIVIFCDGERALMLMMMAACVDIFRGRRHWDSKSKIALMLQYEEEYIFTVMGSIGILVHLSQYMYFYI